MDYPGRQTLSTGVMIEKDGYRQLIVALTPHGVITTTPGAQDFFGDHLSNEDLPNWKVVA